MSDTAQWQRFLELKEKSATPGHPEQRQAREDYRNMLMSTPTSEQERPGRSAVTQ